MKLGKKAIGIFLCFASIFTVLAGCKKKTKKNTTKKNTTNVTTKANTTKINTTKQKTTIDPKKKYMVNEEVFNSYFHITDLKSLNKLNHTSTYTYTSSSTVDRGEVKHDGNVFFDEYYSGNSTDKKDYFCYIRKIDNGIIDYRYAEYDYNFYADENSIGLDEFMDTYLYLPIMNFTDLTFNGSTNSYEAIKIEKTGSALKNVKIQFEDNVLKNYSYEYAGSDYSFTYETTISSVGTTKADSVLRNFVTEEEFNRFFNITNGDILSDLNFTLEYDSGISNYLLKYSNGKALSETYYDDELMSKKYYEITDVDGTSVTYDLCYENADDKWCHEGVKTKLIEDFVWDVLCLYSFNLNNFVFNPETGYYECDSYKYHDDDYSNLKIKFVDGLLDSFTAKVDDGSEYNVTLNISNIGITEIVAPMEKYAVDEETFNSFLGISSYEELKALNYTCDYVTKWGSETVYASNGTFMAIKHNDEEDDETLLYQTSASTTKDVELKISTYNGSVWNEYSTMNLYFFDFLRDYGRMLLINYSNFTYNKDEKCYELDNYEVDLNLNYTDIKVTFEYGKISTISYTVNNFSNSWTISETYSNVGNTSFFY